MFKIVLTESSMLHYYQLMPLTTTTFQPGDRVYLVADPTWTGTVNELSTITDRVQVNWDGIDYEYPSIHCFRFDWWDAPALDYWTRPESAVEVN